MLKSMVIASGFLFLTGAANAGGSCVPVSEPEVVVEEEPQPVDVVDQSEPVEPAKTRTYREDPENPCDAAFRTIKGCDGGR